MTICIHCSSSELISAQYRVGAEGLAAAMIRGGHDLVFGGGRVGLMGVVARAMIARGRTVTGVIPQFMLERGVVMDEVTELVVTANMRERKAEMERRADAFLVLPGGVGTCEEALEVLTLKQLRRLGKPVVFFNTAGYFDPLFVFFESMIEKGFAGASLRGLFQVAADPAHAVSLLQMSGPEEIPDKWTETS